jgi:MFS family permease
VVKLRIDMELLCQTIAVCYLVPIFASTDSIDMERPLYLILASLFLSSLADNALLIVAISSLHGMHAPAWMTPALREVFVVSYVALGAFAGPISDAFPKARVMFCCGVVKIAGCLAMLHSMHPLPAYCIVGLGACFYSPAKFGLITELVPSRQLVKANAWSEGLTVISIIAGTAIGVPCGALAASRLVALENAFCVLPLGAVIGMLVVAMQFVHLAWFACVLLFIAGFCAGFFVVPMNALLQYRGKTLLSTGQSVAVQNFSENAAILLVLGGYSILVKEGAGFDMTSSALGAILVAGTCIIVWRSRQALQRQIQPSLPSHKKHGSDG